MWNIGTYSMPSGISHIINKGEGDTYWDSTAYNMILVNETKAFLDNHVAHRGDDPFFTYVALGSVHIPHSPPDYYLDGSPVAGKYPNEFLSMLDELDKVVGSLLRTLDERQLLEDTMIVFTSDNGGLGPKFSNSSKYGHLSNGPLRGQKGEIYEGGIRIPLTIRWDNGGIPKGEERSNLVGLNDLFSTLCELAGIEVPLGQAIDSISFASHLYNKDVYTREYLGAWTFHQKKKLGYWFESIRKKDMKLIMNHTKSSRSITYKLYNLTSDISESNDISEGNEDLIKIMVRALKRFGPCDDDYRKFKIINRKNRLLTRSCSWVARKNVQYRCNKYVAAQRRCRFTCSFGEDAHFCARK